MAWNPQFWSEHQVSYHFGKPWPYPLQGFIPNWALSLNQWEIGLTNIKYFNTKLLCFKFLENFVLKIIHCGHHLGAHMKKISWISPESRFFLESFFKTLLWWDPNPNDVNWIVSCLTNPVFDNFHKVELHQRLLS